MLRLVHPAPTGKISARPHFRRVLTDEENARVRAAMKNLCRFYGGWAGVAAETGYAKNTLKHSAHNKRENISPSMALAIATLARIPFDNLLSGRPHEVGTCPTCGAKKGAQ